jgi:hypothetical protein
MLFWPFFFAYFGYRTLDPARVARWTRSAQCRGRD